MRLLKNITTRRKTPFQPPLVVEINPVTNPSSFSPYRDDFDLYYKDTVSETYCDSDDDMSTDESLASTQSNPPSQNLAASAIMAQGPYCPRRPKLTEILADKSPPPWTLSAFFAYCSQNHCLENLEFIKDAKRYDSLYTEVYGQPVESSHIPDPQAVAQLRTLWFRLVDTYIKPNSTRELNLTAAVRQPILFVPETTIPPPPALLEPAMRKIYELIEDSILFPFLNDIQPFAHFDEHVDMAVDHPGGHPRPHSVAVEQPNYGSTVTHQASESTRRHTSMPGSSQVVYRSRNPTGGHLSSTVSHSSTGSGEAVLTDDTSSVSSPGASDLMTPPTTPPTSDLNPRERTLSPRAKSSDTWKHLGSKFGFRKRSGSNLKATKDDQRHTVYEE